MGDITAVIPLGVGLVFAFELSNLAGKAIVLVLFLGSIVAWSVMLSKWRELREARRATDRFMAAYKAGTSPWAVFFKGAVYGRSPVHEVYAAMCEALDDEMAARGAGLQGAGESEITRSDAVAVRNAGEQVMAKQVWLLDRHMGVLATAVSAAPFLGLLGTVWGVMDSFSNVFSTGANTLKAVAPGVAGALLTTVVGLLVALPCSIGHNFLAARIHRISVEMENFLEGLVAEAEKRWRG